MTNFKAFQIKIDVWKGDVRKISRRSESTVWCYHHQHQHHHPIPIVIGFIPSFVWLFRTNSLKNFMIKLWRSLDSIHKTGNTNQRSYKAYIKSPKNMAHHHHTPPRIPWTAPSEMKIHHRPQWHLQELYQRNTGGRTHPRIKIIMRFKLWFQPAW